MGGIARVIARGALAGLALLGGMIPVAAAAQERDYCPARPGLGTPPCTMEQGKVSVEVGIIGWTRDHEEGARSDQIDAADTLVRVGVSDKVELFAGWQAYGHVTEKSGGITAKSGGVGDLTFGLTANLARPDGSGFSLAVQPYVTAPTGGATLGAGDWGAGLILPMSYELPDDWSLQFTGSLDAAVDADRKGRHFAGSATFGLGRSLRDSLSATAELMLVRDHDPAGRTTQAVGGLSLGWMQDEATQWDIGTNIGLNRAAPEFALYGGISRRF